MIRLVREEIFVALDDYLHDTGRACVGESIIVLIVNIAIVAECS